MKIKFMVFVFYVLTFSSVCLSAERTEILCGKYTKHNLSMKRNAKGISITPGTRVKSQTQPYTFAGTKKVKSVIESYLGTEVQQNEYYCLQVSIVYNNTLSADKIMNAWTLDHFVKSVVYDLTNRDSKLNEILSLINKNLK